MDTFVQRLSEIVLCVHRRNGGVLESLDLDLRLLDPSLGLDSLDLAEIIVAIEREFDLVPFDAPNPPLVWRDILAQWEAARSCAESQI